jgi:hypothetical protein
MNVTELARRLQMPTRELLESMPRLGFAIGRRAIKVDDRLVERITEAVTIAIIFFILLSFFGFKNNNSLKTSPRHLLTISIAYYYTFVKQKTHPFAL